MRAKIRCLANVLIAIAVAKVALFPAASRASFDSADNSVDLLIVHGTLVDGSGKKARKADIGVRGDRIVLVGDRSKAHLTAARTLDATGMIVAPGFIDPHTHTLGDLTSDQTKSNQAYLMQGVTTVVTGNDG